MKKIAFVLCLLLITSLCAPVMAADAVYYVAPTGSDSSSGAADAPLATLAKAVEMAEGKNATIYLREGSYLINETVALTGKHNGLTIRAYGDEKVTITGTEELDSSWFKKVTDSAILDRIVTKNAKDKIYAADLKANGVTDYGTIGITTYETLEDGSQKQVPASNTVMLYIDGKLQTIARYPNEGYLNIDEVIKEGSDPRNMTAPLKNLEGFQIRTTDSRLNKWTANSEFYVEGYWMHDWHRQSFKVQVDFDNKNMISSEYPSYYCVAQNQRFYFYNLLEELDAPGEWYLDQENGILYLYSEKEITSSNQIALVTSDNPFIKVDNAKDITISGIHFTKNLNYGIQMTDVDNVSINNCEFSLITDTAVRGTGTNTEILSNYFHDLGCGAIYLVGGDRITLTSGNNEIINNKIERFQLYDSNMGNPGIQIDQSVGARIAHNKIAYGAAEAIYYRGNENVIEYNDIGFVCQNTADQGIIHTGRDWTQRGNVIRYNYFHDIELMDTNTGMTAAGVYLDDMHSSTHVYGNVMYKLSQIALFGGGRDNIFENNLMLECSQAFRLDNRGMSWMDTSEGSEIYQNLMRVPYTEGIWAEKYPGLVNILEDEPAVPKGNIIRNNVQYKSAGYNIEQVALDNGTFENNIDISGTKGFVDYKNKDFTLTEDSEIFTKLPDFEPIPFDKMGLLDNAVEAVESKAVTLLIGSPRAIAMGNKTMVDPANEAVQPVVLNDRTLVPVRFIAESFGANVGWDGATETVTITMGSDTITLKIDSKEMNVNGTVIELDVPAQTLNDRTVIPLRAIAESLGKNVFWDDRGLIVISAEADLVSADDEFMIRELIADIS